MIRKLPSSPIRWWPTGRLVLAGIFAGLLALLAPDLNAVAAPGSSSLPALGDSASEEFSVSAERQLGDRIMREARRDPDLVDDPLLLEYLMSLWEPLVGAAR